MANDQNNYSEEDKLKEFVQSQESSGTAQEPEDKSKNVEHSNPSPPDVGTGITDTSGVKKPWERNEEVQSMGNKIGWQKLPVKELPSHGMFYPDGTEISIRAATGAEIRHWSTLNDQDPQELDDMLNYVLERCAVIKFPHNKMSSWKDIKEVDRFYIILAIREYTFIDGQNQLQVKISESSSIDVTKEMVDYINFDERLLKYYDNDLRCFNLKFKDGKNLKVTIPSVGVTNWIRKYYNRKRQNGEAIDEDFITYAPFLIMDWRGLNDNSYEKMVIDSNNWSISQVSVLNEVKRLFIDSVEPKIKYNDEGGLEREIPLNFRGGIKSIFLVSDAFGELL